MTEKSEPSKDPPQGRETSSSTVGDLSHLELLETLIANMPDFIYVKDESSRFVLYNHAVAESIGVPDLNSALGKTDFDFYPREKAERYFADERTVFESGSALVGREEPVSHPGGREEWYSSTKVPVCNAEGRVIGLMGIGRNITDRVRAEAKVSDQAGELRRRNEEMERDLKLAREFQQAMLPRQTICCAADTPGKPVAVNLENRFLPLTGVGGDFIAIRELPDDQVGILLCDAIGHGVRAALITAILQGTMAEASLPEETPAETLQFFNVRLREVFRRQESGLFVTALYAKVDRRQRMVSYARAGHHEPYVFHAATGVAGALTLAKPGPALALLPHPVYQMGTHALEEGDRWVFCTDGLLEVCNADGEEFGHRRFPAFMQRGNPIALPAFCDALLEEARAFSSEGTFQDDISLIAMTVAS